MERRTVTMKGHEFTLEGKQLQIGDKAPYFSLLNNDLEPVTIRDFGRSYGTHIKELRLLSRAVFVLNENNEIVYVEYVPEVTDHPNYEQALDALKLTSK